jgi:hypothetical protein
MRTIANQLQARHTKVTAGDQKQMGISAVRVEANHMAAKFAWCQVSAPQIFGYLLESTVDLFLSVRQSTRGEKE